MSVQTITDTTFKFHHRYDPTFIYTYQPTGEITWIAEPDEHMDDPGSNKSYSKEDVHGYINDGTWVVLGGVS